ncbi:MAG: hypothetical protein A2142_03415 [candidate division Zixibacteria bacterium RBG_16_48_11]|nr:MAG: hypothetical protein A2142_03415 [candidate division Zixibacteria bacterium RBG_16_48_11]
MRIAFIGQKGIPCTWGGVEDFVEQVSTRLVRRKHQVYVYCRPYYTQIQGDYQGVQLLKLPSLKTKYGDALSHTLFSSLHSIFRQYDIIHYQALGPASLSFIPRLLGRTKVVATLHSLDWKRDKWSPLAKKIFRLAEKPAVHFPHQVTTVSGGLKEYLEKKFGKEIERIFTGISPPVKREPDRISQFGLRSGKYLLFLGRLVPEKGCHFLCEAFKELNSDLKLFIAGEGQFASNYVTSLKKYASARIIFGGWADQELKEELFSNCLAFLLPSEVEGFPHTILEAFSYGKPVLASDIPENKEALGPFQLTFRSADIKDLAQALQNLLKSEPSPNGLPKMRKEYVQKNFSWDKTVDDLERIYYSLLSRN